MLIAPMAPTPQGSAFQLHLPPAAPHTPSLPHALCSGHSQSFATPSPTLNKWNECDQASKLLFSLPSETVPSHPRSNLMLPTRWPSLKTGFMTVIIAVLPSLPEICPSMPQFPMSALSPMGQNIFSHTTSSTSDVYFLSLLPA